jgi:uncharacterized OB-fold protein
VEVSVEQTPELVAPFVLEYTYKRSVGPVIGRFLTSLRSGRIEGVRAANGDVLVPATEYDPRDGSAAGEWVDVSDVGVVETWTWEASPRPRHPLSRPFAWAMIRLDGADTAFLHVVDVPDVGAMHTGMRVRARWRAERVGHISDIACFEVVP